MNLNRYKVGLITEYPPFEGGMISRVYLADSLAKHHEVEVFPWNNKTKLSKLTAPFFKFKSLISFFKRNDVVQIEYEPGGYMPIFLPMLAFVRLFSRTPVVLRVHESLEERKLYPLYKAFHDLFMLFYDVALVHTKQHKRLFSGTLQKKTVVLEHAVKVRSYDNDPVPGKLSMVGFIHPRKGCELAIKAVNLLVQKGKPVKLVIAGKSQDDDYLLSLKSLISEYNLYDSVTIIDRYLSEDEVEHHFKTSQAILLPYRRVTMSGILTHVVGMGIPAIISDWPQLKEFLKERLLYFKRDDFVDLSKKIEMLITSSDCRLVAKSQLKDLAEIFSWENISFYNSIIMCAVVENNSDLLEKFIINEGVEKQMHSLSSG